MTTLPKEYGLPVTGLAPITPSTSTPDYVSLAYHSRVRIIICVDNGTTVTGSAITVKQATDNAGTGEKAVSFTTYYANTDTAAGSTLAAATASSDTFTTDTTNGNNLLYVIDVDENDLDLAGGFTHVRAGTGDAANTVLCVLYELHGQRYQPGLSLGVLS